jgi:hypothetical protein
MAPCLALPIHLVTKRTNSATRAPEVRRSDHRLGESLPDEAVASARACQIWAADAPEGARKSQSDQVRPAPAGTLIGTRIRTRRAWCPEFDCRRSRLGAAFDPPEHTIRRHEPAEANRRHRQSRNPASMRISRRPMARPGLEPGDTTIFRQMFRTLEQPRKYLQIVWL